MAKTKNNRPRAVIPKLSPQQRVTLRAVWNEADINLYDGLKLLELLSSNRVTVGSGHDGNQATFAIIKILKRAQASLDQLHTALELAPTEVQS